MCGVVLINLENSTCVSGFMCHCASVCVCACVWRHRQAVTQFQQVIQETAVALVGCSVTHACRDVTNITWPKQEPWGSNSLNQWGITDKRARDASLRWTKYRCCTYFWFLKKKKKLHSSDSLLSKLSKNSFFLWRNHADYVSAAHMPQIPLMWKGEKKEQ